MEHLVDSDLFVVFITSVISKNVQNELKYAVSKEKNILPIYLEDYDKLEMDIQLELELCQFQGILKQTLMMKVISQNLLKLFIVLVVYKLSREYCNIFFFDGTKSF